MRKTGFRRMGCFDSLCGFIHRAFGIKRIIFSPHVTHLAMCVGWNSVYSSTFQRIRLNLQLRDP